MYAAVAAVAAVPAAVIVLFAPEVAARLSTFEQLWFL